jgi:hypothetical protein
MSRERRAGDWQRDIANARPGESKLKEMLSEDDRILALEDHTRDFERLDFSFQYEGGSVAVDLKEKRTPYSAGVAELWPIVHESDLFIVDETVFRRIVWQGGGGYLVVHDFPKSRWAIFGPWELTLGPRVRYQRRGQRTTRFLKGKVLLDLGHAAEVASSFSVTALLRTITTARAQRDAVGAVGPGSEGLPIVG